MSSQDFYATQSRVSDPRGFAGWVGRVPGSLSGMRAAARQLVFHYRADGDYAENGIEPERIHEIDTRYAEDMLARLRDLSQAPLTRERAPSQRMVGCCRDFTVLFLAIARHHGVPARARVGFAGYFVPGWFMDHVVAEVWDAAEQRWRLVDAELADNHTDSTDGARIDPEDVPPGRFVTGPAAWRACRAGTADVTRFLVDPGLEIPATRGWPQVRHNLVLDLAALAKHEMLQWDDWGLGENGEPDADELALLDDLAAATVASEVSVDQVRSYSEREGLRVPSVVTSFSPAGDGPRQVRVKG